MLKKNCQPVALTIAGSDSSGGAGIQADLKTFAALNVYGCSVITALTAQNTIGIQAVKAIDLNFINQQLDSIFIDFNVRAIKIGMLYNSKTIELVLEKFLKYKIKWIILDPVIFSTSQTQLLDSDSLTILKNELIPKVSLVTPNLIEASILLEDSIPSSVNEMEDLTLKLYDIGCRNILLKGGHLASNKNNKQALDLFYNGCKVKKIKSKWVETNNTHGTGCTLSSAITAFLVRGFGLETSIKQAKKYLYLALLAAKDDRIGSGLGPVNHFFNFNQLGL